MIGGLPEQKVHRTVLLADVYLRTIANSPFNLSAFLRERWHLYRRMGRTDWPRERAGKVLRRRTTVSLDIQTAADIDNVARNVQGFNFSSWVEQQLREVYPTSFPWLG